jgi:serine/threonine protein kinase
MASRDCISEFELRRLILSSQTVPNQDRFEDHLQACPTCRDRLEAMAGEINLPPPDDKGDTSRHGSAALTKAVAMLQSISPEDATNDETYSRLDILSPSSRGDALGRLGKYELLHVLGAGGMGVVFSAWDPELNREVAIKVPSPSLIATPEARARFLREARSTAAVKHDNIVTVHAVDHDRDTPYLVMERIAGESLAERLEREGQLDHAETVRIGMETAAALQAAHGQGLVHRDIKPGNILLESPSGRVKVTDFGLAKSHVDPSLTGTGVLAGTPEFMSPEQANEDDVTELSDLFSLGVVLYAACAGKVPFRGKSSLTTLQRICHENARPLYKVVPHVPRWFSDVVERLLAKDASGRPQSAAEVIELLSRGQSSVDDAYLCRREDAPPHDSRASAHAWRWKAPALAAAFIATCLLVAFFIWPKQAKPKTQQGGKPSVTGFVVSGFSDPFSSLGDAIAAAKQVGVVEVHGDGPFHVPSLELSESHVTIRAAEGCQPVFVSALDNSMTDGPFLIVRSSVALDGIDLRWRARPSRTVVFSDAGRQCAIDVAGGEVTLVNCRLIVGRMNGCIYVGRGSVVLRNSQLVSKLGSCLLLASSDDTRLQADNCVFEGRAGIMFDVVGDPHWPPTVLDLTDNTFSSNRAFQIVIGQSLRPFQISATRNNFDTPELMTVIPRPFDGFGFSAVDLTTIMTQSIHWTESKNVYRSGMKYLSKGFLRVNAPSEAAVATLDGWQRLWNQAESESTESAFVGTRPDGG